MHFMQVLVDLFTDFILKTLKSWDRGSYSHFQDWIPKIKKRKLTNLYLFIYFFFLHPGRVSLKVISKKPNRKLRKEERRNQTKQIRKFKREQTVARKRSLGTSGNPPFLVTVIPLSPNINPRTVLSALTSCDPTTTTTVSSQGITHIR